MHLDWAKNGDEGRPRSSDMTSQCASRCFERVRAEADRYMRWQCDRLLERHEVEWQEARCRSVIFREQLVSKQFREIRCLQSIQGPLMGYLEASRQPMWLIERLLDKASFARWSWTCSSLCVPAGRRLCIVVKKRVRFAATEA